MSRLFIIKLLYSCRYLILGCAWGHPAVCQTPDVINFEEEKVIPYRLPEILKTRKGKTVTSVRVWQEVQRPDLLKRYQKHVFGQMPGKITGQHFVVLKTDSHALAGRAISKQIKLFFTAGTAGPGLNILLYLPKKATGPVPVFTGLNFYGNQSTSSDPALLVTQQWVNNNPAAGISENKAGEKSRGLQASRWPYDQIIAAGFGVATAYYGDLEPDFPEGWKVGVRGKLASELKLKPEEWSAISAWAWGLSRMLDYLEKEPAVNAGQVIVTGHSRLGKAALWAGATDQRFAAVVANNSGEGGAALARRDFGETITRINKGFPHWFNPAFTKYNGRPEALPVDQHMLLGLIAPRPLYVASAMEDRWADPKGEYLSAFYGTPVYQLYGKAGITSPTPPPVNQPVGTIVRYHIRSGKHDITPYDWEQYLIWGKSFVSPDKKR